MEDSISTLEQMGFSKRESRVYLTCLGLGSAPASAIADRAGMKRTTVTEVLRRLAMRGVSECFMKKRTRFYSVLSPRLLYEKFAGTLVSLEQQLPILASVVRSDVYHPHVSFFEGRQNLKRLYLDVLTAESEIRCIYNPEKLQQYFTRKWIEEQFIEKRIHRKIPIRGITPDSSLARLLMQDQMRGLRKNRIIQSKEMQLENQIFIYANKVSIMSFEGEFGLLIESRELANTMRVLFDLCWNSTLLEEK